MATARILQMTRCNSTDDEMIDNIEEFSVPENAAKRRRMLMTRIGKLIDASLLEDGPSSVTINFSIER